MKGYLTSTLLLFKKIAVFHIIFTLGLLMFWIKSVNMFILPFIIILTIISKTMTSNSIVLEKNYHFQKYLYLAPVPKHYYGKFKFIFNMALGIFFSIFYSILLNSFKFDNTSLQNDIFTSICFSIIFILVYDAIFLSFDLISQLKNENSITASLAVLRLGITGFLIVIAFFIDNFNVFDRNILIFNNINILYMLLGVIISIIFYYLGYLCYKRHLPQF